MHVQGKCTAPPTGDLQHSALDLGVADEEPWRAPRCVIVTSEDLFVIDRSRLWIDALHIQVVDGRLLPLPINPRSWGVAYVTNTAAQGEPSSNAIGVEAFRGGGGLYAEGARACVSEHLMCSYAWPLYRKSSQVPQSPKPWSDGPVCQAYPRPRWTLWVLFAQKAQFMDTHACSCDYIMSGAPFTSVHLDKH